MGGGVGSGYTTCTEGSVAAGSGQDQQKVIHICSSRLCGSEHGSWQNYNYTTKGEGVHVLERENDL